MGKLCAGALLLILSNAGFAESFQDRLYIDATAGVGTLQTDNGYDIDVEKFTIGGGLAINQNLFIGGRYGATDFEGVSADLFQAYAGLQEQVEPQITLYGTVSGNYWDSSDFEDTESGFGVGIGIIWGRSQLRYKVGYEYFSSLADDPIFDEIHVLSVGIQYNFGGIPQAGESTWMRRETKPSGTSIEKTTACKSKHRDLFFMCNPEPESNNP